MPIQRVRPNAELFRQGLIGSVIFITTVFVVLYFLTVPSGPWLLVLGIQLVVSIAVTLAAWGYFSATIWVGPHEISERGFFGRRRRYPAEQIDSILLATVSTSSGELLRQLFVRDAEGHQLVRMRGQFWSSTSIDTVASVLEVPVVIIDEVTTVRELRTKFPLLLFWFDRQPVLAIVAVAVSTVAGGIGLFVFLRLIGAA